LSGRGPKKAAKLLGVHQNIAVLMGFYGETCAGKSFVLMHPIGELSADDWTKKNPAGHDL